MKIQTLSKALIASAVGSLFALGASSAFADSADLTLTGKIVPGACIPTFNVPDNTVDLGTTLVADLAADTYNLIPGDHNFDLTVACTAPVQAMIWVQDSQASSRIVDAEMNALLLPGGERQPQMLFGLGTTDVRGTTVNLGSYSVRARGGVSVDGVNRGFYAVLSNGSSYAAFGRMSGNGTRYAGFDGSAVATGKTFVYPLAIAAALNHGANLQVANDVDLNGQAVFSISYR